MSELPNKGRNDEVAKAISDLREKDAGAHAEKAAGVANAMSSLNVAESLQLLGIQMRESAGVTRDGIDKSIGKLISSNEDLATSNGKYARSMNWLTGGILFFTSIQVALTVVLPYWERKELERSDIQAVYQAVDANEDIFIDNYNQIKNEINKGLPITLPQQFIVFPIDEKTHDFLKRDLGIDLYRYFLYYLNQTELLNDEIANIRSEIANRGSVYLASSSGIKVYWAQLSALDSGGWQESKFNYIHDLSCLEYILVRTYKFLSISERSKTTTCSSESLNRIFYHFGYIESEMPTWIKPELKAAVNEREAGMGDHLIR